MLEDKVKYAVLNSNNNRTALVTSGWLEKDITNLSKEIIRDSVYKIEQVGFVEIKSTNIYETNAKLLMMGDEFCGNAIASLGVYMAVEEGLMVGKRRSYNFEVSGSDELIKCNLRKEDNSYIAEVSLPLPLITTQKEISFNDKYYNLDFIYYKGIQTITINTECFSENMKMLAEEVLKEYGEDKYPLNIVTLFSVKRREILPLVYIPLAKTKTWESSCAMASASSVLSLKDINEKVKEIKVIQPLGLYIKIFLEWKDGEIIKLSMEEEVFLESIDITKE